jgi:hypothetical protein
MVEMLFVERKSFSQSTVTTGRVLLLLETDASLYSEMIL